MSYLPTPVLLAAALLTSAAASCEPDDVDAGPLPGAGPDTPYVYAVDETHIPDGLTLIAAADQPAWDAFFGGDVRPVGEVLVARSTDRDRDASALHLLDAGTLRELDAFVLPPPHSSTFNNRAVCQTDGHILYAGKDARAFGMSATFDLSAGALDPLSVAAEIGGGERGRAILVPNDGAYTYAHTYAHTVHLVRVDPRTGDTAHLAAHPAIDSTWKQELLGFAEVEHGGQHVLTYFVRSYSEAISAPTFRVCAYDLAGDSLRYDLAPEALGLRPDQATSIHLGSAHDGVVAYQLGYQYVGLDPFALEVLWTHDTIADRLIFANAGEYRANAEGIVVFPSNGAAPTCGIDVATGEILWVNEELRPNGSLSLPLDDRYTLYCDIDAVLHCVEARTGEIKWSMASPTLRNGRSRTNFVGYFALDGRDLYIHDPWRLYKFRIAEP